MTAPDLSRLGGISNYVNVFLPYLPARVELLTRGSRHAEEGFPRALTRVARDSMALARSVRDSSARIVHQNTSFGRAGLLRDSIVPVLARSAGKPLVVFLHGWDRAFAAGIGPVWRWYLRRTLFQADAIVVLAHAFADQLRSWGYAGRIYVDTTIVDDEFVPAERGPLRDGSTAQQPVRFLFMARLEAAKGVITAIRAVGSLLDEGLNVELVIAGDGSDRERAEHEAARWGDRIIFAGVVSGPQRLATYQSADVFLFPTEYGEGMPTAVLEAMCCGLPVITRPVGGMADFFESGRMGYADEATDPAVFAGHARRLATDPQARVIMSRYNAEYAAGRFHASRVTSRITGIYQDVLGQ